MTLLAPKLVIATAIALVSGLVTAHQAEAQIPGDFVAANNGHHGHHGHHDHHHHGHHGHHHHHYHHHGHHHNKPHKPKPESCVQIDLVCDSVVIDSITCRPPKSVDGTPYFEKTNQCDKNDCKKISSIQLNNDGHHHHHHHHHHKKGTHHHMKRHHPWAGLCTTTGPVCGSDLFGCDFISSALYSCDQVAGVPSFVSSCQDGCTNGVCSGPITTTEVPTTTTTSGGSVGPITTTTTSGGSVEPTTTNTSGGSVGTTTTTTSGGSVETTTIGTETDTETDTETTTTTTKYTKTTTTKSTKTTKTKTTTTKSGLTNKTANVGGKFPESTIESGEPPVTTTESGEPLVSTTESGVAPETTTTESGERTQITTTESGEPPMTTTTTNSGGLPPPTTTTTSGATVPTDVLTNTITSNPTVGPTTTTGATTTTTKPTIIIPPCLCPGNSAYCGSFLSANAPGAGCKILDKNTVYDCSTRVGTEVVAAKQCTGEYICSQMDVGKCINEAALALCKCTEQDILWENSSTRWHVPSSSRSTVSTPFPSAEATTFAASCGLVATSLYTCTIGGVLTFKEDCAPGTCASTQAVADSEVLPADASDIFSAQADSADLCVDKCACKTPDEDICGSSFTNCSLDAATLYSCGAIGSTPTLKEACASGTCITNQGPDAYAAVDDPCTCSTAGTFCGKIFPTSCDLLAESLYQCVNSTGDPVPLLECLAGYDSSSNKCNPEVVTTTVATTAPATTTTATSTETATVTGTETATITRTAAATTTGTETATTTGTGAAATTTGAATTTTDAAATTTTAAVTTTVAP
ncbi:hypothetical protein BGX29_008674 [Mortierella sp. GBA35]|nr:hypothetical protein BGX29_008674 [Mortierella sp. GBA35]